jgi:hypothetical protein
LGENPNQRERHRERNNSNQRTRAQVRFERAGINLGASKKGKHTAAQHCEKADPFVVRLKMQKIAGYYSGENLNQGD